MAIHWGSCVLESEISLLRLNRRVIQATNHILGIHDGSLSFPSFVLRKKHGDKTSVVGLVPLENIASQDAFSSKLYDTRMPIHICLSTN